MIRTLLFTLIVTFLGSSFALGQEATSDSPAAAAADDPNAAKYAKFTKLLSGSKLVGKFTIVGRDMAPPKEEYELIKVNKLPEGDFWEFYARIKYGKTNLLVPLKIEVKWAGDTPMITLTDFKIPGLGTFSSRVMFYNNKYAGTWTHGKVHGHMFGVIEKVEKETESSADSP